MRALQLRSIPALAAALCACYCACQAQSQEATNSSQQVPRTADGKPDFSGVWQNAVSGLTTNINTQFRLQDNRPFQPWAAERVKQILADADKNDPSARCLLPGVPRITNEPFPLQIIQTPGQIAILYEAFHAFRVIPTDGRGHPKDLDPTYLGDSAGHWEGDTLVVDVTGFNDRPWVDHRAGIHSEALHVTERYRRPDFDTIDYTATIEDPKVFTKPWPIHATLKLRPNERVMEYECIENNLDVPHLVGPKAP